jgi:hypothetical protein
MIYPKHPYVSKESSRSFDHDLYNLYSIDLWVWGYPFWETPDIPIEQPSNLVRCGYHDILKIQWDMTLFYKQLT